MKVVSIIIILLIIIVVFYSMIIIHARFHPNPNQRCVKIYIQIKKFFTKHQKPLKKAKSKLAATTIFVSLVIIISFYAATLPINSGVEEYLEDYIQKSVDMELTYLEPDEITTMRERTDYTNYTVKTFEENSKIYQKYYQSHTIYTGLKLYGNRGKLKGVRYCSITFKDDNTKKHFQLIFIERTGTQSPTYHGLLRNGVPIKAKVNQSDLEDKNYGTTENPIPVMMFSLPQHNGWKDYERNKITEEQYKDNVYFHLGYIMPKEKFDIRFKRK